MSEEVVNRSDQVENRLKAIRIHKQDFCLFFEDKTGGLSIRCDCFSCKWSLFKEGDASGLCKYKK